jgi:GT2 family glycosyltransferase
MDVSVVVNTRDRPDRLRTVLSALAKQTGLTGAIEVLVVDDGSTMDIRPALAGHGDLTIRCLRQPPLGYTVARNAGLRAATADVVLCLDDDVVFDRHFVGEHLRVHRSHPAAVVVGDRFNTYLASDDRRRAVVDAALDGDWSGILRHSRRDYYASQTLGLFDRHPHAEPAPWLCFVTRNVSFRSRDAALVGGFDEGFTRWGVDDIELGLRLYRSGVTYHYRPDAVVYHLETPLAPGKLHDLVASLAYFSVKHPGVEPTVFREFVFGRLSLEELCASVDAGRVVSFERRDGLTFFTTRR